VANGHAEAVDKREVVFILALGLAVLVVTSLPALYGYLSTPSGKVFSGIVFNAPDVSHNFAWMRHFRDSAIIENWMTPEDSAPVFFNLLWWVWGNLSGWMGWSYGLSYQLLRLVAGILFLGLVIPFMAFFVPRRQTRMLAGFVIIASSGLGGWFVLAIKALALVGLDTTLGLEPLDLFVVESNTFFATMVSPHFVISLALVLAVFWLFMLGRERGECRYAVGAGLVGLVLGLQHAYDLLLIYGVIALFLVLVSLRDGLRLRSWLDWILIGMLSCPGALYSLFITQRDPVWKEVLGQFVNAGVFTPDPWHLLILLGLPLIVAILTFDGLVPLAGRSERELFIKSWFLMGGLLIYVPTSFQIHYLNGWQVPIGILASRGFVEWVAPWFRQHLGRGNGHRLGGLIVHKVLPAGLLLALVGTNVYLTLWSMTVLNRHEAPHYLTAGDVAAMDWLDDNTLDHDVILSSLHTGHHIPSRAGNKAFIAHWAATVDFRAKRAAVRRFYDASTDDAERRQLLREFDVRYVYHGDSERALGSFSPARAGYLKPVFMGAEVAIYEVVPETEAASQPLATRKR